MSAMCKQSKQNCENHYPSVFCKLISFDLFNSQNRKKRKISACGAKENVKRPLARNDLLEVKSHQHSSKLSKLRQRLSMPREVAINFLHWFMQGFNLSGSCEFEA